MFNYIAVANHSSSDCSEQNWALTRLGRARVQQSDKYGQPWQLVCAACEQAVVR